MTKVVCTYLLMASFCLPLARLYSQDFASDMKKINKVYGNITEVDMKISYKLFATETSTEPIEHQYLELKQKGKLQYTKREELESLNTDQYLILIDHEDRTISVQAAIEAEAVFSKYPIPVDSMLGLYDSIHFRKIAVDKHAYTIYLSDFEYERIELIFHPTHYLIEQITYYGSAEEELEAGIPIGKPRYEISYTQTMINPHFSAATFSSDVYLQKKDGNLQCKGSYKQYQLINHLQ